MFPHEPTSPLADIVAAKSQGAAEAFLVEMRERSGWPRKEIHAAFGTIYYRLIGLEVPQWYPDSLTR